MDTIESNTMDRTIANGLFNDLDVYQVNASFFSSMPKVDVENGILMSTLGLAGEAGEVVDKIKKFYYHGHSWDIDELELELGDVLWYVSELAKHLGLSLSSVARSNIKKLERRYPKGYFESEKSINRSD